MYVTVFDVQTRGFHSWLFLAAGCAFVLVGAVCLVIARGYQPGIDKGRFTLMGVLASSGGLLFGSCAGWDSWQEYRDLRDRLRLGRYELVEGLVTNYSPEDAQRHRWERWDVAGHQYVISSYVVTSGFQQVGVVHPGDRVRLADVDGTIARLEVQRRNP